MAAGYRTDNPTDEVLLAALPRNGAARRHMAALPTVEVPAALAAIDTLSAARSWTPRDGTSCSHMLSPVEYEIRHATNTA